MKDKSIQDPFYSQIQKEIDRIESKDNVFTWMYYTIRTLQILLTGTITLICGLFHGNPDVITATLILGALATTITATDSLFQVEAKKNAYKLVLFEIRALRAEYVYQHHQNEITSDFKKDLFEKYKKAISYARELIGADHENEPLPNEQVTALPQASGN